MTTFVERVIRVVLTRVHYYVLILFMNSTPVCQIYPRLACFMRKLMFLSWDEQEKHLRLWLFECKEPSHEAFVLGAAAIGLLVIAHLLANLLGGCSVCSTQEIKNASTRKQIAIAFLAFTWYIYIYMYYFCLAFSN